MTLRITFPNTLRRNSQAVVGLLAMPQEIQNQIYALVFSELVHVRYDPPSLRPVHFVCRLEVSEKENYENFMSSMCWTGEKHSTICSPVNKTPFCLALLRFNKQISGAAKSIAMESTTFSFGSPIALGQFVHRLPRERHLNVRKIRLDMTIQNELAQAQWGWMISNTLLPHLSNVRHLYLCLWNVAPVRWTQTYAVSGNVENMDWMQPISVLARLELAYSTVVFAEPFHGSPEFRDPFYGNPYLANLPPGAAALERRLFYEHHHAVKKNFAEHIRKKLLRKD